MTALTYHVINAFSEGSKPFTGNAAAVFCNADEIPDSKTKQAIAKQLNLVETTFVHASTQDADFRFQYFTPYKELPVTGHPTIAALWALHEDGRIKNPNRVQIETAGGILTARFENSIIWITQRPPVFRPVSENISLIATAIGLNASDILTAFDVSDAGLGHIIVQTKSTEALYRASVDIERLASLCAAAGAREAQLFTIDEKQTYHTRNLCPRSGEEDPACGNGNAALGSWLAKQGLFAIGERLTIAQGRNISRPCLIHICRLPDENGQIVVTIGGSAHKMSTGQFYL